MPSPLTQKRNSRRETIASPLKTKSVDAGSPLGPQDSNSVRDRILQWQAQAGESTDDCNDPQNDEPPEPEKYTPKRARAKSGKGNELESELRNASTPSSRRGRHTSRNEVEEKDRNRSSSAPRKRVVSDRHWRKDKSPRRSTTFSTRGNASTPTSTPADVGIRMTPDSERRAEIRRKRQTARQSLDNNNACDDDGIRVYVTPPGSRKQSRHLESATGEDVAHDYIENSESEMRDSNSGSHLHTTPWRKRHTKSQTSPKYGPSIAKEDSRRGTNVSKREITPEKSPRSAQESIINVRGSAKSQKSGILGHVLDGSKKIFTKSEPSVVETPRIPSIEAWLNDTPDPFIDADEPPVEVPLPLKTSARKRRENRVLSTPEDKEWEPVEASPSARSGLRGSKRRQRVPSSTPYDGNPFPDDILSRSPLDNVETGATSAAKFVDLTPQSPTAANATLKRRGANRDCATPNRVRRKSTVENDVRCKESESDVSPANAVSSEEPNTPVTLLRPPGLNVKRENPSSGKHKLSTIASVETFNTRVQSKRAPSSSGISEATAQPQLFYDYEKAMEERDQFDVNDLERKTSKRRLTKHSDLISILSLPRAGGKSIRSARSIRTNRSRLATATIEDLLQELVSDEGKYMRELRTLVDGVIPVLLTSVLSKSDSAVAAGLFKPAMAGSSDPNLTKPIVDMGIALERLKTLHKRIPVGNLDSLLTWAQGAQRVYSEYLKAWRAGFQDVVINLASAQEANTANGRTPSRTELDEGLPRNQDGDVVNGDGERVDVAFLLKRPLVRLKYLAKTFKGINTIKPSPEADALASIYAALVDLARHRSNEERARLEDEAASSIDPTRARDPRTLAPLAGVKIDNTRRVRARDHFDLMLQHSSGQRVDCRVELLLRDDAPDRGNAGDLLICEVDSNGRWLLLPPVQTGRLSARNGDSQGEIVVMIRGLYNQGQEWHELLSLQTDDEAAGFEWVQMFGLTPVPPKLSRTQSFLDRKQRTERLPKAAPSELDVPVTLTAPGKSRTPSPREIEVPIGEQARGVSKPWNEPPVVANVPSSPLNIYPRERARLQKKPPQESFVVDEVSQEEQHLPTSDVRTLPSQKQDVQQVSPVTTTPTKTLSEKLGLSGSSPGLGLRRTKAKRVSRYGDPVFSSPQSGKSEDDHEQSPVSVPQPQRFYASRSAHQVSDALSPPVIEKQQTPETAPEDSPSSSRPLYGRSRSSVPSMELPIIPKIRQNSPPTTPTHEIEEEPEWPVRQPDEERLRSGPTKLTKARADNHYNPSEEQPPPTPTPRSPSPVQLKGHKKTPSLTKEKLAAKRRSSSPLKHEYEPSTASDTTSDSGASTVAHNERISVSDSSEEEEFEDGDVPTPLLPVGAMQRFPKALPPGSIYSIPNGTITPSQSASQAPYKTVPAQPSKAAKAIGSIFFWSDQGSWQALHPDECSIVVTPGLIEAYEMSASHSLQTAFDPKDHDSSSNLSSNSALRPEDDPQERPLVGLELTPLVPIRRGTALDISIRSPPTPMSKITSGTNIMFRSRSCEECEALYSLINYARINNPTYIALQNARPFNQGSSFSPSFDRSRSVTKSSGSRSNSWFNFGGSGPGRKNSYRASSAPTPSIALSESSIGSMTSAFSALKRFGRGGSMFNIAKSTITSRNGDISANSNGGSSSADSMYNLSETSSGASTPHPDALVPMTTGTAAAPSSTSAPGSSGTDMATPNGNPIGLTNAKIRLYIRETASKWRDMGSARLSITQPSPHDLAPNAAKAEAAGQRPVGLVIPGEKRVVVLGKAKRGLMGVGEREGDKPILLDCQLGEQCFERIARTGIALSVWEDFEVGVEDKGGVGGGRARVYMIQVCRFIPCLAIHSFFHSFCLSPSLLLFYAGHVMSSQVIRHDAQTRPGKSEIRYQNTWLTND